MISLHGGGTGLRFAGRGQQRAGAMLMHADLGEAAGHGLPADARGQRDLADGYDVPFDSARKVEPCCGAVARRLYPC
jgi:hypothetical protein